MAAKIHSMDNGPLPEVQCSDLIGRRNRLAIQPLDMRRPAQRDGGSYQLAAWLEACHDANGSNNNDVTHQW